MSATPPPVVGLVDTCGFHNSNLEASTLRIMQGASWKRQNTVILLPAADKIMTKVAMSWMHLMTPPNQRAPKIAMLGMEVGDAYTQAIDFILRTPGLNDCEYVLTIEHDQTVPPDGLLRLLAQMEAHPEFACIGGLYWTKGEGGVPQIWGDPRDPIPNFRPQPPDPKGGLVECCGTGMGFNLWRMSVLADPRLPKPLFKTVASLAEGVGTQDLRAWGELRKLGYRAAIDCSCLVGHVDEKGFVW